MDKIASCSKTYSKLLKSANINEDDVMIIWDTLSLYIREELSKKRGKHLAILPRNLVPINNFKAIT